MTPRSSNGSSPSRSPPSSPPAAALDSSPATSPAPSSAAAAAPAPAAAPAGGGADVSADASAGAIADAASDVVEENDGQYEVERLCGYKVSLGKREDGFRKRTKLYLVKWANYNEFTWERTSDIDPGLMVAYHREHPAPDASSNED